MRLLLWMNTITFCCCQIPTIAATVQAADADLLILLCRHHHFYFRGVVDRISALWQIITHPQGEKVYHENEMCHQLNI